MNAIIRYVTNMDARAVRAILVSVALFLTVVTVLVIGKTSAVFDEDDAPWLVWLQASADRWWSLPAAIVVFTLAAFVGAPQFVLIAVAVVAFGPVRGFAYSWIATMVSATVDFYVGRFFGARVVRRYGGDAVNRISRFVGDNGFMAALTVRIVPSAPFIIVNMAAGVSQMSFPAFAAGTGLGIVPKTALVAFASGGVMALWSGADWTVVLWIALAAAAWLAAMLAARSLLHRRRALRQAENTDPD